MTAWITPTRHPELYALDDGEVFWGDERGVVAVGVAGGGVDVLDAEPAVGFRLYSAERGVLAFSDNEGGGLRIGSNVADAPAVPDVQQFRGVLSPDARHYSLDDEELTVVTADGTDVSPNARDYFFSAGYAWLDDDTIAVVALRIEDSPGLACSTQPGVCDTTDGDVALAEDPGDFSLLTCSVPSGACETTVADVGPEGEFVLPVGVDLTAE